MQRKFSDYAYGIVCPNAILHPHTNDQANGNNETPSALTLLVW